ncbi:pyridoxal-phosphate dependent enzyme [Synergistaceae bacterium OttesenSCG-928-D05]|nr:pyridoxal-phosphate dependent enzyme [Synergistaceae bacterium OttesenSCG-928-D05]
MFFYCKNCGKKYPADGMDYKCECGGLFELGHESVEIVNPLVSIGETDTPMLERTLGGVTMQLKLDYYMPTGSFKDRGAYVLINKLKEFGINEVVEDSSGNAGAAIAGYCAAAGIKCSIYVPESTSEGKIKQVKAYGANLVKVPGSRDDTSHAIQAAAQKVYYASHVYNPLFFEGTKSIVPEIIKQCGIPDYVVVPAGNGTMLLGVYLGFKEFGKLPKIIAAQSAHCTPVYSKFKGLEPQPASPTAAEGIAVGTPMRIEEMIQAVRESGGDFLTVEDEEVLACKDELAAMGIYCEPTSGVAVAAAKKYFANGQHGAKIVVPLTGSGLKK